MSYTWYSSSTRSTTGSTTSTNTCSHFHCGSDDCRGDTVSVTTTNHR